MTKKKHRRPNFATIGRRVLSHPPIRHKNTPADKQYVTPLEFAVAVGCIVSARAALSNDNHARALKAGQKNIDLEKLFAKEFKDTWRQRRRERRRGASAAQAPAPECFHAFKADENPYQPSMTYAQNVQRAGKVGYKRASKALRKRPPPEIITVELSRYALLQSARLRDDGDNMGRLSAALDRLVRPIGIDGEPWDGPLASWQQLTPRKIELRVRGLWLEAPFGRVPLPLPVRSSTALALYLFLHTIQFGIGRRKRIKFERLCALLGIPWNRKAKDALNNALGVVNKHLDKLPLKAITALLKHKIKVPERYELKALDNEYVRFTDVPRQLLDEDAPPPRRSVPKPKVEATPQMTPQEYEMGLQLMVAEYQSPAKPRVRRPGGPQ